MRPPRSRTQRGTAARLELALDPGEAAAVRFAGLEPLSASVGQQLPAKEGLEQAPLVGTALVAHVHSLVKGHRPVLAHVDDEVPQLSPGHHHEGQVGLRARRRQPTSGAHPTRGLGLNRPPHRPPPQPKQPVQQGQEAKAQGGQAGYGESLPAW